MPALPPTSTPLSFDVCIVGAGPAGTAAAWLLRRQGRSVALIDRARFPRDKTCGDGITPRGARVLARIGALDDVVAKGFSCHGVDIRGPGPGDRVVEFTMRFDPGRSTDPSALIVLPRMSLDDLLLRHALAAGPAWFDGTKVVGIETFDTHARVVTDTGLAIDATTVVLATGAESQLLRACGLLAAKPAVEHAARVYYDGVRGLTDRVVLFFDGVDLPGYGWIFPTSPTSANIGCGVFAQDRIEHGTAPRPMAQAQRLEMLLATHPLLRRMLADATPSGPVRAYPLRTDFHRDHAGRGRLMVVGEAAGLVNPITGEGIDYALESAEFLAAAFDAHWPKDGAGRRGVAGSGAPLDDDAARRLTEDYRTRLSKRFTRRFSLYRAAQRHALAPERTPALLAQVAAAPALQRLVVASLFGRAKPTHLLRPTTLWQIARLFARGSLRGAGRGGSR